MTKMYTFILLLFSAVALMFILSSAVAYAAPPVLIDPQTGKYLGNLSANPYDPDSVSNTTGQYGSPYSQDSINNPVGEYGSPYSDKSINNPYATNPPIVIDTDEYNY